jgi:predicted nucleic acid-binding protein
VILIDAGPLVALMDADHQYHEKCVDCLKSLREPLVTVWPPLVEAAICWGIFQKPRKLFGRCWREERCDSSPSTW